MRRIYSGVLCGLLPLLWAGGAARADHWTSPEEVARAAHALSDQAEHFHKVIHDLTGFSHLAGDAHRLAESAEHFHRSVEEGAGYRHALRDYDRLQDDFGHLRRAFRLAHGEHHEPHVARDWERLSRAFDRLSWAMGEGRAASDERPEAFPPADRDAPPPPRPAPSGRHLWVYGQNGKLDFRQLDERRWAEEASDGTYHYREVERTPEYVEMFDPERQASVRLYAEAMYSHGPGDATWHWGQPGHWAR